MVVLEVSNIADPNAIIQGVWVRLPDWIPIAKMDEFVPIKKVAVFRLVLFCVCQ